MADMRQALGEEDVRRRLRESLPHWSLADGWISRRFTTQGWKSALMVVNAVGHLAEVAWHHPEVTASYGWVEVRLQSHDAGGVTDRDLALAAKIEEVVLWRPAGEGGPLTGTPADPRFAYILDDERGSGSPST